LSFITWGWLFRVFLTIFVLVAAVEIARDIGGRWGIAFIVTIITAHTLWKLYRVRDLWVPQLRLTADQIRHHLGWDK